MKPNMKPLAQAQARIFHAAYERCLVVQNGVPTICELENATIVPLFTPAYVCVAFSAEIGLKVLLDRHGIAAHGHNLQKLFQKLPEDTQIKIKEIASPYVDDFDADLAAAKDAFVFLRYMFEHEGPAKEMNLRVVAAISMATNQLIGLQVTAA